MLCIVFHGKGKPKQSNEEHKLINIVSNGIRETCKSNKEGAWLSTVSHEKGA